MSEKFFSPHDLDSSSFTSFALFLCFMEFRQVGFISILILWFFYSLFSFYCLQNATYIISRSWRELLLTWLRWLIFHQIWGWTTGDWDFLHDCTLNLENVDFSFKSPLSNREYFEPWALRIRRPQLYATFRKKYITNPISVLLKVWLKIDCSRKCQIRSFFSRFKLDFDVFKASYPSITSKIAFFIQWVETSINDI